MPGFTINRVIAQSLEHSKKSRKVEKPKVHSKEIRKKLKMIEKAFR